MATMSRPIPASNMKPAMTGPSAAPPRPSPITNPVPPARTSVGKRSANSAYSPTMAEFVNIPASPATSASWVRSAWP